MAQVLLCKQCQKNKIRPGFSFVKKERPDRLTAVGIAGFLACDNCGRSESVVSLDYGETRYEVR